MDCDLFSDSWAAAMHGALGENPRYRAAAGRWEGALVLALAAESGEATRAVWLDLERGSCRAARAASADDLAEAPYVIVGNESVWRSVLSGEADALGAVLRGRLRLARGSLARLLPFAEASQELVRSARTFSTRFPGDPP